MNHDDERDHAEEAANRDLIEDEHRDADRELLVGDAMSAPLIPEVATYEVQSWGYTRNLVDGDIRNIDALLTDASEYARAQMAREGAIPVIVEGATSTAPALYVEATLSNHLGAVMTADLPTTVEEVARLGSRRIAERWEDRVEAALRSAGAEVASRWKLEFRLRLRMAWRAISAESQLEPFTLLAAGTNVVRVNLTPNPRAWLA